MGGSALRQLDRGEHDRLARQPGPVTCVARSRSRESDGELPGVFSGWAGHCRRQSCCHHPERGVIRIFRLRDKQEIQSIETPCPWIESLAFTPDGKRIAAGLLDTSIVIWDVLPAH